MSTVNVGIYKLLNDVILSLSCQTATIPTLVPTVMVRFIQATSIVQIQLEDFEFITKLNEELSNFEFVKRPVESSLSVCSML